MPVINFSGLASGIDTNALIDATLEAGRKTRIAPSEERVTQLEETNSAFEELTGKLETLQTTLKEFSTLNGGGVSKAATSSRESVATAAATNAAVNGSYSLTVNTLAKNHTYTFTNGYASPSTAVQAGLGASTDVTVTIGQAGNQETVVVTVPNGSFTISEFVTSFNNSATKAEASLVNMGTASSPSYRIVLSSNYEGEERGDINVTVGGALTNLAAFTESVATNASLTIDGIGTVTRASNSIADVIPGVTMSLVSTGTATIKVAEDEATTTSKVQEYIDAYNDIVTYMAENNLISREEDGSDVTNIFGPLASTSTDDGALTALRTALSGTQATGGSTVRIFADLGITTERDGTLKFDTDKFKTALATEPTSVSSVLQTFADTTALTSGTIDQYIRFNGLFDVAVNGNKTLITNLNDRIATAEAQLARQESDMRQRFARLESLIGKLQNQQSSLTSALAGLGGGR